MSSIGLSRICGRAGIARAMSGFRSIPICLLGAPRPSAVPAEWSIVPADESDFARPGSVVPAEFSRNARDFLDHVGGWRAESNGFRGALAFTSFRLGDEPEIGIETHPDARGRGLATAVAARMIEHLSEHGITPVWSCRESDHASVALARKLGFRPVRRLPYDGLASAV